MPNQIFNRLVKAKIKSFIDSYAQLSREVFCDETKRNKISHPGEFGTYREALIKDFIKIFIPERLQIASGFAINANDQVSHQLDVIIYDPAVAPKIENSSHQRFFPIECICGVGEVKSVIHSKSKLCEAIEGLWQIKQMATNLHHRERSDVKRQLPFTFLFCEKIVGSPEDVNQWFVEIYKTWQIPKKHWHNVIASIDTGIFKYTTMQDIANGSYVIPKGGIIAEPVLYGDSCDYNQNFHIPSRDNGTHLISFGHDLSMEFIHRNGHSPDLIAYTDEFK